jgi:hypothetical protein
MLFYAGNHHCHLESGPLGIQNLVCCNKSQLMLVKLSSAVNVRLGLPLPRLSTTGFTSFGIENLKGFVEIHKANPTIMGHYRKLC